MDPNNHDPAVPASATIAQCDECGAPVDEEQRYCVDCGAHRRHVSDPAARYLSQVSARTRTTRAAATARRTAGTSGSRTRGIGVAVALALIPAAAAVGVLAGRSSNNDDAHLIQALARQQAAANRAASGTSAATSTVASVTATGHGAAHSGASTGSSHASKPKKSAHNAAQPRRHRSGAKASKPTGSTVISTAPPTAAQKQTGAQDTEKVQKAKGKSYVHQQSSLPGTVVVP